MPFVSEGDPIYGDLDLISTDNSGTGNDFISGGRFGGQGNKYSGYGDFVGEESYEMPVSEVAPQMDTRELNKAKIEHKNLTKYHQDFKKKYSGEKYHRDTATELRNKNENLKFSINQYEDVIRKMEHGAKSGNDREYRRGAYNYEKIARPNAKRAVRTPVEVRTFGFSLPIPFLNKTIKIDLD